MGEGIFDRFPESTELACDVLGYDLRRLCLKNPDGLLDDTAYTQPALYAVNALSYWNSLKEGEPEADVLLGHSLGEYNALLAAGAFDFETGLKLVIKRGELMAQAPEGAMLAVVGLPEAGLRDFLADEAYAQLDIANLNTPAQTVLSGPDKIIAAAQRELAERKVRVARLRVSAPFHSRYMEGVREEFAAFLKGFRFAPLRKTVIANVTARPYRDRDIARTLTDQISGSVRWLESVRRLLDEVPADNCREAGHGSVLTRMLRQIESGSGEAPGGEPEARRQDGRTTAAVTGPPVRPRLFCIAYAGGDARSYAGLAEHCPELDVATLERPGRGRRASEPLLSDPEQIVDDLLAQLRGRLDAPFALYGHSLGARLAFLLCRRLRREGLPAPVHLLVSGECGPSIPSRERETWKLSADAFWDHLKQLGGVPEELFQYDDLVDFYERILRADFTALGAYVHQADEPLDLPITAVVGEGEWFSDADVDAWQSESTRPLTVHRLPGDHFFIRESWDQMAKYAVSGFDVQTDH